LKDTKHTHKQQLNNRTFSDLVRPV